MINPIITARGQNGQLEVYEDKITIRRKGFLGLVLHGFKGDKDIRIDSISSIQFKPAGFTNGYIQFAFMGGVEAKRGVWQATQDENTVMFTGGQQFRFERAKSVIEEKMNSARKELAPHVKGHFSVADEIAKLAELRSQGILTEQEFEMKKKEILGF